MGSEPQVQVLVGDRLATHLTGGDFDLWDQRVLDPGQRSRFRRLCRRAPCRKLSKEEVSTVNPYS